MTTLTETDRVLEELREADKLLLTTHENPDGDALGSLLGMHEVLRALGKDAVMFMAPDELPLPPEYCYLAFDGILTEPPPDIEQRTVVFLDCGNIDRMPVDFLQRAGVHILNIDHHHDNTCFGTVNLVRPGASCTAEIVFDLAHELGVEITLAIAEPLYAALITDTGRFTYKNTTPRAHQMAAELIEVGLDIHESARRLYEDLPYERLLLLSRALANVQRLEAGQITLTHLSRSDFEETGSSETDSEGIVDHMRAVQGTAVGVLVRELLADEREGTRKVSLRATDGRVDVSRIARGMSGGGHPQAAGFSSSLPLAELVEMLRLEVAKQL